MFEQLHHIQDKREQDYRIHLTDKYTDISKWIEEQKEKLTEAKFQ